jgi:hypothetical protein
MDKDLALQLVVQGSSEDAVGNKSPKWMLWIKATIVIEHLICVSMSLVYSDAKYRHIYRKWNARLFEELYRASVEGRSTRIRPSSGTRRDGDSSTLLTFRWRRS